MSNTADDSQLKFGADSSLGGGERGKDVDMPGGSEYGDGRTEFGGAGRLNDASYTRGEPDGSVSEESTFSNKEEDTERSKDLSGRERELYP
ncbi:hypothetical protein JCM8547_003397 [Rhodosporidiobolus lusitaniae]